MSRYTPPKRKKKFVKDVQERIRKVFEQHAQEWGTEADPKSGIHVIASWAYSAVQRAQLEEDEGNPVNVAELLLASTICEMTALCMTREITTEDVLAAATDYMEILQEHAAEERKGGGIVTASHIPPGFPAGSG